MFGKVACCCADSHVVSEHVGLQALALQLLVWEFRIQSLGVSDVGFGV